MTSKNSVFVGPGARAITRTPWGRASHHRACVKLSTNAFAAAYTAREGTGWNAVVLETLRMVPGGSSEEYTYAEVC